MTRVKWWLWYILYYMRSQPAQDAALYRWLMANKP